MWVTHWIKQGELGAQWWILLNVENCKKSTQECGTKARTLHKLLEGGSSTTWVPKSVTFVETKVGLTGQLRCR